MRRPEEVLVVVHRAGAHHSGDEPEFLVLERSPERQGYWHVVAGALDAGEDAAAAARRELREETGLEATPVDLGLAYRYSLEDEPPEVRERFEPDVMEIAVVAFAAEAPATWERSGIRSACADGRADWTSCTARRSGLPRARALPSSSRCTTSPFSATPRLSRAGIGCTARLAWVACSAMQPR
jgi:ADP-ribose pyrophosphatase YjhB (NUDIX family)